MQHSPYSGGSRESDHLLRVILGVPSVNHQRLACLGSHRNLGLENRALHFTGRVVVVVVKATFPNRDRAA